MDGVHYPEEGPGVRGEGIEEVFEGESVEEEG